MNSDINTYALNQNPVDSASIGPLGFAVHGITKTGNYIGTVTNNGQYAGTFRVSVTDASQETQADIDLASFAAGVQPAPDCCKDADLPAGASNVPTYEIGLNGYVELYASNGPAVYQATLDMINADGSLTGEFDSTSLNKDDIFVVMLMRPGRYLLEDRTTGATTHVTVSYPPDPDGAFVQPDPINISVGGGFDQQELTVLPSQGMIFTMSSDGHSVRLTLETPDDGPGAQNIRWTNPDQN
jgi:hypothetical protein